MSKGTTAIRSIRNRDIMYLLIIIYIEIKKYLNFISIYYPVISNYIEFPIIISSQAVDYDVTNKYSVDYPIENRVFR
jgi:hypothetical protein